MSTASVLARRRKQVVVSKSISYKITSMQLQVWQMIAHGYSRKEIATRLGISNRTVDNHRLTLTKNLGMKNLTDVDLCWLYLKTFLGLNKPAEIKE